MKYNVQICGEEMLPISHNLSCKSGDISEIRTVASRDIALAQCRGWLRKNLPDAKTMPVFSTTAAAKMAAEDPSVGAITGTLAVKTYELQVVVKGIEDYQGNSTRFLIIGKQSPSSSGSDKTSLLIGLMDKPGALNEVLALLSAQNINLTKIESRPIKGKQWKYLFFLDMLGHMEDENINKASEHLKEVCSFFEWLGSYPLANNNGLS